MRDEQSTGFSCSSGSATGEPPADNPAYYLRYCKTFASRGGVMRYYASADNRDFLPALWQALAVAGSAAADVG